MPSLSPRQIQVLTYLASGKTYCETALLLGIKIRTVYYHASRAVCKLETSNIISAVARAVELGLVVTPVTYDKMTK